MIDVTVVVTAHREGLLLAPALAGLAEAVAHARRHYLAIDVTIVLDRADRLTQEVANRSDLAPSTRLLIDAGDPASARNAGVAVAAGRFVSFLDGDDVWGYNWLTAAYAFCVAPDRDDVVAHSELNLMFGDETALWWHPDSADPRSDPLAQGTANQWDAMCFTGRDLLQKYPFRRNDVTAGYGHEDWDWNNRTLQAGVVHRPVPGTVHFKRVRSGSQSALCSAGDVIVRPSRLIAV